MKLAKKKIFIIVAIAVIIGVILVVFNIKKQYLFTFASFDNSGMLDVMPEYIWVKNDGTVFYGSDSKATSDINQKTNLANDKLKELKEKLNRLEEKLSKYSQDNNESNYMIKTITINNKSYNIQHMDEESYKIYNEIREIIKK